MAGEDMTEDSAWIVTYKVGQTLSQLQRLLVVADVRVRFFQTRHQ